MRPYQQVDPVLVIRFVSLFDSEFILRWIPIWGDRLQVTDSYFQSLTRERRQQTVNCGPPRSSPSLSRHLMFL